MSESRQILDTRRFREFFIRCLSRYPVQFRMAVPYISGIPHWHPVTHFCNFLLARECALDIITAPPGRGGGALSLEHAEIIEDKGVNLLVYPGNRLHAKMYQFTFREGNRSAFVGSANFSNGGFKNNDEIVAFFPEKCDNEMVARQFDRLLGAGIAYRHWKVGGKSSV